MSRYVSSIKCTGIYGRFDLEHSFRPGVNVIYGINGSGKTTMLHILANVLNGDFRQFAFLDFRSVEVELGDGTSIRVLRTVHPTVPSSEDDDAGETVRIDVSIDGVLVDSFSADIVHEARANSRAGVRAERRAEQRHPSQRARIEIAYFPAFRVIVDAWVAQRRQDRRRKGPYVPPGLRSGATDFARQGFGEFVPAIGYPSVYEVQTDLARDIEAVLTQTIEVEQAAIQALLPTILEATIEQSELPSEMLHPLLSRLETLLQDVNNSPVGAYLKRMSTVFESLRQIFDRLYSSKETPPAMAPVLQVYMEILEAAFIALDTGFRELNRYFDSVNRFLDGKRLEVVALDDLLTEKETVTPIVLRRLRDRLIAVSYGSEGSERDFQVLSSGERQIVTLMYAVTHMGEREVVLIDEPELSLHVDWQRRLFSEFQKHLGDRQVIACTHSPLIYTEVDEIQMQPAAPEITQEELPF